MSEVFVSEAAVKDILADHYAISSVIIRPLPGEVDLNFLVESNKGKRFVFKVASRTRSRHEIEFQLAFLAHLSRANLLIELPEVVSTVSGDELLRFNERMIHLLTWVEGTPLREATDRSSAIFNQWGGLAGRLSAALKDFDHDFAHRTFIWDPAQLALSKPNLLHVASSAHRALAERMFSLVERLDLASLTGLRMSVNYSDAHEDNILVSRAEDFTTSLSGLIDVGDAVYSYTVSELAIACAYAAMDQPDPLGIFKEMLQAYQNEFALSCDEISSLFPLIISRLLITVCSAAEARISDPDNIYRSVSEEQAWALLEKLDAINPLFATHYLLECVGLLAKKSLEHFHAAFGDAAAIIKLKDRKIGQLDLSIASKSLGNYASYYTLAPFTRRITRILEDQTLDVGIGGYLETRPFYTTDHFTEQGNNGPQWRTLHLGLDLWSPAGEQIYAPFDAIVHSFRQNNNPRDYGATIVLKHEEVKEGRVYKIFTLYGHLSAVSLVGLVPGKKIAKGEAFAKTGNPAENGGWPPHLHFQVMHELYGNVGDFPGVGLYRDRSFWATCCPDPLAFSGLSKKLERSIEPESSASLVQRRSSVLGRSLSVSYDNPLHMVRGIGAYLLDHTGRRYLDTVNNVAHVGHEHPHVVQALQHQAGILNTNTRYLHEEVIRFAERLVNTMPDGLEVVHLVNSGSEANELALRMARTITQQQDVLALEIGYHGNTGGTIDVSSYKFDGKGGRGAPESTHVLPMPNLFRGRHQDPETAVEDYTRYIDEAIVHLGEKGKSPAAFLAESILSCGGQVVLPEGYLKAAYAKTRAVYGVCIADEVQTGMGRVGTHWWAFETQGVVPDIVTIGKPIGNGHPLAAVVCTREVAEKFAATGMEYFNTFGGNPVSAAVGNAVLDVIEQEDLRDNAQAQGAYLLSGLEELQSKYSSIGDVRGMGLFLGIELVLDRATKTPHPLLTRYIANRMRARGILMSTDGPDHNVLKIKPPMSLSRKDAHFLLTELDRVLASTTAFG